MLRVLKTEPGWPRPKVVDIQPFIDAMPAERRDNPYFVFQAVLTADQGDGHTVYPERVRTAINHIHLFVDEHGRMKDLPRNEYASTLYKHPSIVGVAYIVYMPLEYTDDGPDFVLTDMNPDLIHAVV